MILELEEFNELGHAPARADGAAALPPHLLWTQRGITVRGDWLVRIHPDLPQLPKSRAG